MENMSDRIKRLRISKNLTQQELGEKLGMQRAAINKYESGLVENMKRSTVQKMAKILGVTPAYLMCWEHTTSDIAVMIDELDSENKNRLFEYYKELLDKQKNESESYISDLVIPNVIKTETSIKLPMWINGNSEDDLSVARFVNSFAEQSGRYYSFGGSLPVSEMSDETLIEEANELLQIEEFVKDLENQKITKRG